MESLAMSAALSGAKLASAEGEACTLRWDDYFVIGDAIYWPPLRVRIFR